MCDLSMSLSHEKVGEKLQIFSQNLHERPISSPNFDPNGLEMSLWHDFYVDPSFELENLEISISSRFLVFNRLKVAKMTKIGPFEA